MTWIWAQVPSARVDDARFEYGTAARATLLSGNSEPYALADGQTLLVAVDGAAAQTVTFNEVDFDNIAAATAAEVALVVGNGLAGATAEDDGGDARLYSATYGTSSQLQVTGGTANAVLGFSTSAVFGSNAAGVFLANRIPEPDEARVALTTDITVDVVSGAGTAPAFSDIDVYVGGVLAFDSGAFQSGYGGANSAATNPTAAVARVVIDKVTPYANDLAVVVRVVVSGGEPLDQSYTFRTLDLTAPHVDSVAGTAKKTVRVTFSEAMEQGAGTAASDALNPACYAIAREDGEVVADVSVVSVAAVSSTAVDLTTDVEMTFGARYYLTVTGAEDAEGNVVDPLQCTDVEFYAFIPEYPAGREFSLWRMLPEMNRLEDSTSDAAKFIACLQEIVNLLLSEVDDLHNEWDVDTASEQHVDAMLDDLGNPFKFAASLSLAEKRKLVQLLVPIYQTRGTKVGLEGIIRLFMDLDVDVVAYNSATDAFILGSGATHASLLTSSAEPYVLANGQTLLVRVDGALLTTVVFATADFLDITNATAAEIAVVLDRDLPAAVDAGAMDDDRVLLWRVSSGDGTALKIVGGTATALDFPAATSRGAGAEYSGTTELGDSSYLGYSRRRQIYSFEVDCPVVLTDAQRETMRSIISLCKPPHTHLVAINEPTTEEEFDHVELGLSELGRSTTYPGEFVLH